MLELYRDAGIDIDLYRDEPGLEIDRGMGNSRDRGGHGNDGVHAPLESQTMYRDFDFLDQPALDALAKLDRPGAFIFNCWVEAWGRIRGSGRKRTIRTWPPWPSWTAARPRASSA